MKNQLISNSKLQVLVMFSSVRVKRVVEDNKAAGGVARRPPSWLLLAYSLAATSLQPVWIMLGLEFAIKTKKRHALRVNREM